MVESKSVIRTTPTRTCGAGQYEYIQNVLNLKTLSSDTGTSGTQTVMKQAILRMLLISDTPFYLKVLIVRGTWTADQSMAVDQTIKASLDAAMSDMPVYEEKVTLLSRHIASALYSVPLVLDISDWVRKAREEQIMDLVKGTTHDGLCVVFYTSSTTAAKTVNGYGFLELTSESKTPKMNQ